MTNTLISVLFAVQMLTNGFQKTTHKFPDEQWRSEFELHRSVTTTHTILSNWVAHVNIDGRTNTVILHTTTNSQWTVASKYEWVSVTNHVVPPPETETIGIGRWFTNVNWRN